MIRHRPAGGGHPYLADPDQRLPTDPVAGEPIELRATAPISGGLLAIELDTGSLRSVVPAEPLGPDVAIARRPGRGRRAWTALLPAQAAGTRLRYAAMARLVSDDIEWLRADRGPLRVRFALRLGPEARVIGFGERFDVLDQRGRRLDVRVYEQYKNQGNRTYMPVPFAIVVPGAGAPAWGFHVRTTRRSWYDVGATREDRLSIEVALDPADLEPTVEVRLYLGTPADILRAFLAETGGAAVPPAWVFHPWMSGNEWNTEARIRAEVIRSLELGIPVGVIVIEAWSDESTFVAFRDARYEVHVGGEPHRLADFTFPPDGAWPNPKGLVDWLHANDIRVLLWQVPLLRTRPLLAGQPRADRDLMVARGYGVRQANRRPYRNRGWWFPGALMPDWTNPDARAWWLERRRYLIEELGIDGFKTDGGEHAWGDALRYADGTRGSESNNRVPVLAAAAYQELLQSAGRDPVTFSRAGFTGAASVPLHWAGDEDSTWEAFRASITAGLSAGASGIFFWGWDLAGFSGEVPSAELYLRATAMACFCPVMQYHAEYNHHRLPSNDRTPWNIAERTGDPRVIPIFRRFAQVRERIVPYLVEQATRSVETGRPLMRALGFEWPDDPQAWDHPYEYLLGDDLLVAPIVETGVTSLEVYLPIGEWVDFWTEERIDGGRTVRRDTPLEVIPVYRAMR
jgi:alpha-glucosidase (family GH31 glycosyl hydrolase)